MDGEVWDAIVVGLGAMGTATLSHLSGTGGRFLGLEASSPGNELGSSHGESRMLRRAYFEGARYAPLLGRAVELWDDMSVRAGTDVFERRGMVTIGAAGSRLVTGTVAAAEASGVPFEVLTAGEVGRRFGAFELEPEMVGVLDPGGGVIRSDIALKLLLARARARGAEIRLSERVLSWRELPGRVEVTTTSGAHRALRLAICAGPWTPGLLAPSPLAGALRVEPQPVVWLEPVAAEMDRHSLERLPPWLIERRDGSLIYGFGAIDQAVKVGRHHADGAELPANAPAGGWGNLAGAGGSHGRAGASSGEALRLQRDAAAYLPGLSSARRRAHASCPYTSTEDHNFVIGRHPDHERVLVAAGFSGHGFKFSPVVGEIMAELVIRGCTRFDIGAFDPRRPHLYRM